MAMKLPDASALGAAPPVAAGAQTPHYSAEGFTSGAAAAAESLTKVGRGIADLAGGVQSYLDRQNKEDDTLQAAQADADYTIKIGRMKAEFERDPDYETAPQRFEEAATQARVDSSQLISGDRAKQMFVARHSSTIANGALHLESVKTRRRAEDSIGDINAKVDELTRQGASGEVDMPTVQERISGLYRGAIKERWITPTRAQIALRQHSEKIANDRWESLPDEEKVSRGSEALERWKKGAPAPTEGYTPQDRSNKSVPASIRYNNPGAQWPSEESKRFGMTDEGVIGGGNRIAGFPTPVHGLASNIALLDRRYIGKTVGAAIKEWSGGGRSSVPGFDSKAILTKEMAHDPDFWQAMAGAESGKEGGLSNKQISQALEMVQAGSAAAYEAKHSEIAGQAPAGAPLAIAPGNNPAEVTPGLELRQASAPDESGAEPAAAMAQAPQAAAAPSQTGGMQLPGSGQSPPRALAEVNQPGLDDVNPQRIGTGTFIDYLRPRQIQAGIHAAETRIRQGQAQYSNARGDEIERTLIDAKAGKADLPPRSLIENDERLLEPRRNMLLRHYDSLGGEVTALQDAIKWFNDPKSPPLNPYDKGDRKTAEMVFQALGGNGAALQAIVDKAHVLPDSVAKDIRGSLVSNDASRVEKTLTLASNLSARVPNIFVNAEGHKDITDAVDSYRHDVEDLGFTAPEATKRFLDSQSPEHKSKLAKIKGQDLNQLVKDKLAVNDLRKKFDELPFYAWKPSLGSNEKTQQHMFDDYAELFKEKYLDGPAGGDVDKAKDLAQRQLARVWGMSSVSGSGIVVKFPPEKAPAYSGIPNVSDLVAKQAIADIKAETGQDIPRSKIVLGVLSGGRTSTAYLNGEPPPYSLGWFDKNGVFQSLGAGRGFVADLKGVLADQTRQRAIEFQRSRELFDRGMPRLPGARRTGRPTMPQMDESGAVPADESGYARGGAVPGGHPGGPTYTGPIIVPAMGKADSIHVNVPRGSYILPADIPSAVGQGNSLAGHMRLNGIFGAGSQNHDGVDAHAILVSGGEHIIAPDRVNRIRFDGATGPDALDKWVEHVRGAYIDKLENAPDPKRGGDHFDDGGDDNDNEDSTDSTDSTDTDGLDEQGNDIDANQDGVNDVTGDPVAETAAEPGLTENPGGAGAPIDDPNTAFGYEPNAIDMPAWTEPNQNFDPLNIQEVQTVPDYFTWQDPTQAPTTQPDVPTPGPAGGIFSGPNGPESIIGWDPAVPTPDPVATPPGPEFNEIAGWGLPFDPAMYAPSQPTSPAPAPPEQPAPTQTFNDKTLEGKAFDPTAYHGGMPGADVIDVPDFPLGTPPVETFETPPATTPGPGPGMEPGTEITTGPGGPSAPDTSPGTGPGTGTGPSGTDPNTDSDFRTRLLAREAVAMSKGGFVGPRQRKLKVRRHKPAASAAPLPEIPGGIEAPMGGT